MMTVFNKEVDLLEPTPEMIDIRDIAHNLSRQARYNGGTYNFISVAEHSMVVADILQRAGEDKHTQFCGLMHDAHEAYIGDMTQPMKTMPELGAAYARLEHVWQDTMAKKYELSRDMEVWKIVHKADMDAAAQEMRDQTTYEEDVWRSVGNPPDEQFTRTMDHHNACIAFIKSFEHLGGKRAWE